MVFIVMGVSGSGKTTVGRLLADRLGLEFHDGDDYQPPENVAKMRQGTPLDDQDRKPWLEALAGEIRKWRRGQGAVLACSALRERYRAVLTGGAGRDAVIIFLHGSRELLERRLKSRQDHYFKAQLLQSQLDALEVPERAITVGIEGAPEEICDRIIKELSVRGLLPK